MSTTLVPLVLGGVPEHFMVPLEIAARDGRFKQLGFEVEWKQCPAGTAEMLGGLTKGTLDIAFPLTESAVAGIASATHPNIRIIGSYVNTPLNWAISVATSAAFKSSDDLVGTRCAISRYGSGSHVMAAVFEEELRRQALAAGRPAPKPFEYVVAGTGDAMKDTLVEGKADFFMWEYFTSKPWYDQGSLCHLTTRPTPWPAFCIASTTTSLSRLGPSSVRSVLNLITDLIREFKLDETRAVRLVREIQPRYAEADARAWFAGVRYESDCASISKKVVEGTVDALKAAGVLKGDQAVGVWGRVVEEFR
ncbi:periplasmic binding protein-like II [Gonapodya prolifera JEL478]|uniref:Periplasmic binding protein-like II n=1 Tax=Gonapodya prolifera (strain JEL478) TaxID=1344416 RepID=A0A139AX32_GONPJ|nr:periplasmic binding protein-like II [Gonapodya prolifera JEL478]|eukprot:KXS21267.1 periplasmic binding protein-like II [Gonapodya prolifera JEL478]